jgi:hypothetical protein
MTDELVLMDEPDELVQLDTQDMWFSVQMVIQEIKEILDPPELPE